MKVIGAGLLLSCALLAGCRSAPDTLVERSDPDVPRDPPRRDLHPYVPGDVIVGIDGEVVRNTADLRDRLEGKKAGDKVKVTLLRDDRRVDVDVTLGILEES